MVETIGWIVVRKIKEGDAKLAQAIQDQFKIKLSEEMNNAVAMLEGKREERDVNHTQGTVGHEDVEKRNDYIKEKHDWVLEMAMIENQKREKVCPKCGRVSPITANFCGKCRNVFEDENSIGPLQNSLTEKQFAYLSDIKLVLDNHDISGEESAARIDKIKRHHSDSLSIEERDDAIIKYLLHVMVK